MKLLFRVGFIFWFLWQTLNFIGDFQTRESAAAHRGEWQQMILDAATAPPWWIPATIMVVALVLWFFFERRRCAPTQ